MRDSADRRYHPIACKIRIWLSERFGALKALREQEKVVDSIEKQLFIGEFEKNFQFDCFDSHKAAIAGLQKNLESGKSRFVGLQEKDAQGNLVKISILYGGNKDKPAEFRKYEVAIVGERFDIEIPQDRKVGAVAAPAQGGNKYSATGLYGAKGLLYTLFGPYEVADVEKRAIRGGIDEKSSFQQTSTKDADKRWTKKNGEGYAYAQGSTWSPVVNPMHQMRPEDIHNLGPSENYDANAVILTKDHKGKPSGGIISSADGYGRPGMLLINGTHIFESSLIGSKFLSEQLAAHQDPDQLKSALDQIVKDTDKFMGAFSSKDNANLAGVRVFPTDPNGVRILGVNIGNQRIMVTDTRTGETTQLNNVKGRNDCREKCCLGGDENGKPLYNSEEVEPIDQMVIIPKENVVVWIATDGAWQNFHKNSDNSYIVDTALLGDVLKPAEGAVHDSSTISKAISDHISTRSKSSRERLHELAAKMNSLYDYIDEKKQGKDVKDPRSIQELQAAIDTYQIEFDLLAKALDDATVTVIQPFAPAA